MAQLDIKIILPYLSATNHRLENLGILDLVMIEVQSGDYLGEDNLVRIQDIYGRA